MKKKILNAYNELIDFRPVDETVVAAYNKVVKIINSCVTTEQLETAKNCIEILDKRFGKLANHNELRYLCLGLYYSKMLVYESKENLTPIMNFIECVDEKQELNIF
jgi:tRNA splicing ligase